MELLGDRKMIRVWESTVLTIEPQRSLKIYIDLQLVEYKLKNYDFTRQLPVGNLAPHTDTQLAARMLLLLNQTFVILPIYIYLFRIAPAHNAKSYPTYRRMCTNYQENIYATHAHTRAQRTRNVCSLHCSKSVRYAALAEPVAGARIRPTDPTICARAARHASPVVRACWQGYKPGIMFAICEIELCHTHKHAHTP